MADSWCNSIPACLMSLLFFSSHQSPFCGSWYALLSMYFNTL